jgi:phenylalanyl-tRNA synthetase beta chain
LQDLAGGEVLQGVVDVYPRPHPQVSIRARVGRINQVLGTTLTGPQVTTLLGRLGITAKRSGDILHTRIPSFRTDLTEEIDLVEEVGRLYGYNKIGIEGETRTSFTRISEPEFVDVAREQLIGGGFNEIVVNSLQKKTLAKLGEESPVEVLNPVSTDMEMLRTSLVPGALEVAERNYNRGARGLRLFECGKVYWRVPGGSPETLEGYQEEERLLMLVSGEHFNRHYSVPQRDYDLLDLKGELEALLSKFFLDKYRLIYYDNAKSLSVDNILVEIQGTYAGFLGRLKKEITAKFGIEEEVFAAELNLSLLSGKWDKAKRFTPLIRFPSVTRDLAFVVEEHLPQSQVEDAIRKAGGSSLAGVALFDLYTGDQIGAGRKSLAYALEFQPKDRTMTDGEVNEIIAGIIRHVAATCGATVRS